MLRFWLKAIIKQGGMVISYQMQQIFLVPDIAGSSAPDYSEECIFFTIHLVK